MDLKLVEIYKIPFDQAMNILNQLSDDNTYIEPLDVVSFNSNSDEMHFFLAFSHITKRCGDRLWSAPDGWGTKPWIAAHCQSPIFQWVLAIFKSSVEKNEFESALRAETSAVENG